MHDNYKRHDKQAWIRFRNVAGSESMVKLLIENGADVNGVSTSGQTVLMRAADNGNRQT